MARALAGTMEEPAKAGELASLQAGARVAWVQRAADDLFVAWNDARDIFLLFHGRDFDLEEKECAIRARGSSCQTQAECLVRCYEAEGEEIILRLNGRFSGVIIDRRADRVLLFNDRFGASRVHVHATADGLWFASDAAALLAALPATRRIDPRGLGEFFSLGCVMQNRTLFAGIMLLPPGSLWSLHADGRVEKRRYFSPEAWEQQPQLAPEEFCAQLTELFAKIVPRYRRGPGQAGMSMTGGLDSRMVLAWAGAKPGELPCYTFGGPYRDCADVRIGRRLSKLACQPHHIIPVVPGFFSQFLELAERTVAVSGGTMDVSGSVELHANRLARKIAPVRLTGNYGSEVLRANIAFRPRAHDPALFTPEFFPHLASAAETYRNESAGHRLSFIAFKQVPWHHHARLAIEAAVLEPRSPFLDNALVALAYRTPFGWERSPVPALRATAAGNADFAAVSTDRAVRLRPVPVLGAIEHCWQEFTAKAEYAWDYGMPQALVRATRPFQAWHVERVFLGRHKFYHFRSWYRDELSSHLGSLNLEFDRLPPCYAAEKPRRLVEAHTTGSENRTLDLHRMLTLHFINRQLAAPPCRN
ncbi:MAG: hypothetical protein JNL39_12340 [Opitutaceae bacterium]|nr:hypothetical protein [Opitutaceae bacterium]